MSNVDAAQKTEKVEEMRRAAANGDVLGLDETLYATVSGDDTAEKLKQALRLEMTPGQIEEAQPRAKEFLNRQERTPTESSQR